MACKQHPCQGLQCLLALGPDVNAGGVETWNGFILLTRSIWCDWPLKLIDSNIFKLIGPCMSEPSSGDDIVHAFTQSLVWPGWKGFLLLQS